MIYKEYIQTKASTIGSRAIKLTECNKQESSQKHEYLQIQEHVPFFYFIFSINLCFYYIFSHT